MMQPNRATVGQFVQILACAFVLLVSTSAHATLSISNVTTSATALADQRDSIRFSFKLSQPAQTQLAIYNPYGEAVRVISSKGQAAAGDQSFAWDGRDAQGRLVPPEAYVYTLTANNGEDEVIYDLTDITGGESVVVSDITYDPKSGQVSFDVDNPGRIFLRVGIENGFVLKTLINNEVSTGGAHKVHWDGWDNSKVLSLTDHPKLRFYGSGYRFSDNTILVSWDNDLQSGAVERDKTAPKRKTSPRPPGLDRHAYHEVAQCRDVTLQLELPGNTKAQSEALPIVQGLTPWRVTAAPVDQLLIESERSEIVFFLDNQLLYENETSYFPYTWKFSPEGFAPGIHYMTAFIVGFREHFGFATVKFELGEAADE